VTGGLGEITLMLLSQNLGVSDIRVWVLLRFVSPFFPHEDPQETQLTTVERRED
jgi:hypothetical protein